MMPETVTRRSRLTEEAARRTPRQRPITLLRVAFALAIGPCWAAVARAASGEDARWLYDAGAPWAAAAFGAAWLLPFRPVAARMLAAFVTLALGLVVYYLPYPPSVLWLGFAVVAAAFYGLLGWWRSRGVSGWKDVAVAGAVGGPFFLQASWSMLSPYGAGEGTLVFAIAGAVVSAASARSPRARLLAPVAAVFAGAALFMAIWAVAGSSLATELL
ncbi:hypothetical protein KNO15_07880 [Leifsonia shinshuensis]|uniref:hypothetical protein n=1 Tax=Leifsonia shinshuensis TaxID=150026 RepID=UPI001F51069D|nr:hypothetical protein [Leifsonia shinshuensis]MCI0156613.1 hypothetical protein [Leifsonia shinshuensis]